MIFSNYFLSLEERFIALSRYIEIDDRNDETFSSEIALMYMASCSEFEVVAKQLCVLLGSEDALKNIFRISKCLKERIPDIFDQQVTLNLYGLTFNPLGEMSESSTSDWWTCYNKVKHDRSNFYHKANLLNLILSMCALQIVSYYFDWMSTCPEKPKRALIFSMPALPKIFRLSDVDYHGPARSDEVFDI